MTTIIATRANEPYEAVVLASDFQFSGEEHVYTPNAILLKQVKDIERKIFTTDDKSILIAPTGKMTDEMYEFMASLNGIPTSIPPFNLVDELRNGHSPTIERMNDRSMKRGEHINPEESFNSVIVYRCSESVEIWEVTEIGKASPIRGAAFGSGGKDAAIAYQVLSKVGEIPACYETELEQQTYKIIKAINYAALTDKNTSGTDVFVVSKQGMRDLTIEFSEKRKSLDTQLEREILTSLRE